MVLKFHPAPGFTERPERMNVAITRLIPVAKLYPQFERCPGLAHELRLIEAEHVVEDLDMRQRRFTAPDGSDVIGFDEGNAVIFALESTPDPCGAHPPRRTPAHDDDSERRRRIVIPNRFAHGPPWHGRATWSEEGSHLICGCPLGARSPPIIAWRGYRAGNADQSRTNPSPCRPVWLPGSPRNHRIPPAGTGS